MNCSLPAREVADSKRSGPTSAGNGRQLQALFKNGLIGRYAQTGWNEHE
jgi:hypothetical protein